MAQDSFDPIPSQANIVSRMEIVLHVDTGSPPVYGASYQFEVVGSVDGEQKAIRAGNLQPHLTAGQASALKGFLDAMMAKAQGVVG